ncbi:MAG: NAD-dependent epimerase [Pigmentiphaga sp.]|nr:NAD-dependent epimerase [Pigmentiphaga sp.]
MVSSVRPIQNNKSLILVTGAAGFIGFHLVKRLLHDDWQVVGLDNINDYYDINLKYARLKELGIERNNISKNAPVRSLLHNNFSFVRMNLEDEVGVLQLFDTYQFQYICHLAAQAGVRYSLENPMAYINSNIVGFTNILECAKNYDIKHLVYASSSSVYGLNAKMPFSTHEGTNHPVSLYAATKKSNELMAHVYSHLYNLPTTGLRFFTVYGPWGRPDMSPMLFADSIMQRKPIKIFNHGNMTRDFTYVDDVIEGMMRVINRPANNNAAWDSNFPDPADSSAPYRIYNIGNSSPVRLMDYVETMENAFGKQAIKIFLPMQAGDVQHTFSDVSDLKQEFDYRPNTSLKEGLKQFAKWYRAYYF